MRRLLYCLLGSAVFHAALLWVPLPMGAGGADADDLLLVRVRFVGAPASDAVKRSPPRNEQTKRHGKARQARTDPRRVTSQPPRAEPLPPARVSKATPVASKPVVAATRPKPATEPSRTKPVAATPARTEPAPKPRRTRALVRREEPAQPDTVEGADGAAADPLNAGTVPSDQEAEGARDMARGTPAAQVTAGGEFSPVRYARTVKPRYPRKARRAGWEGTTLLKVLVNPDGAPGRVAVERTSGFDILDEAAVKAVRRWRFHAARRGVAPLSSWVRIPVAFRLEEVRR
ncbi:MAG: energy transducer TonB [Deltaproteobacteria bacterium]|nr:energy transducer TonB [Deltaproteobacteria bacterium]